MLGIFKKKTEKPVEQQPVEKKIKFSTLLDLLKNGELIGLKVKNHDTSDNMVRILTLDGFEIYLSEWAEWTLRIQLMNGENTLTVYETSNLKIKWYENNISWANYNNKPLEVEWAERGKWCVYITNTIENLKEQLDAKRRHDADEAERKKAREKEIEAKQLEIMKGKFNDLYKDKK